MTPIQAAQSLNWNGKPGKRRTMSDRLRRLLNALILLGAITLGAKAVELHNLWMCAAALFAAYSYTLFTEDKK